MLTMNLVLWTTFGILAGITALVLNPRLIKGGVLGPIMLGILGSIIGGMLASVVITTTGQSYFSSFSSAIALALCISLLAIQRMFRNTI